jgi:hypothetical protein
MGRTSPTRPRTIIVRSPEISTSPSEKLTVYGGRWRFALPLLDPQVGRELGIIAANLLDEALGVFAADEHLERVARREVGRERVVDDGVDDHDQQVPTL